MRSLVAVALVAAAASTASANPYLGLGIGTAASPSGEIPMGAENGNRTGRLLGGMAWGHFAVEGDLSRFGMWVGSAAYDGTMLAATAKYGLPLGDQFEAFGRAGLQRSWLSTDTTAPDYVGNGWVLAAGFEYRLTVAGTGASVFVDYERTGTGLLNQNNMKTTRDEQFGLWTLGATVSL